MAFLDKLYFDIFKVMSILVSIFVLFVYVNTVQFTDVPDIKFVFGDETRGYLKTFQKETRSIKFKSNQIRNFVSSHR